MGNLMICCQGKTALDEKNTEARVEAMEYKDSAQTSKHDPPKIPGKPPYLFIEDLNNSKNEYSFLKANGQNDVNKSISYLDRVVEDISAIEEHP